MEPNPQMEKRPRAAEFFAGIGLVHAALEEAGVEVVWANDIEPVKHRLYAANYEASHYVVDDVRHVRGADLPTVDLATASFPCTDLSLAGWRRGLAGDESSMFWEFARVLDEMGNHRPSVVLLENVPGFATSNGGADLRAAVAELNRLGYSCDPFLVNATHFVPQSRPRLFVVGCREPVGPGDFVVDQLRPQLLRRFVDANKDLRLHFAPLDLDGLEPNGDLSDYVENDVHDSAWWGSDRSRRFIESLSQINADRLASMKSGDRVSYRTAYRRTRNGVAVWEIRDDPIAGCLRTAKGGSSKQAVVEAGAGRCRVRWMTAREYARLQGVSDDFEFADLTANQVMFGFGDAVCVPVVSWIAANYLVPQVAAAAAELACA